MSSPEPPKSILIPAGLPLAYVGGWAATGLASLAYISMVAGDPGGATLEASARPPMETAQLQDPDGIGRPAARDYDERQAGAAGPDDTQPLTEPPSLSQSPSQITNKYVTTQQILATRQGDPAAPQQPQPPAKAFAPIVPTEAAQAEIAAIDQRPSRIVTGSIAVPPPPDRAPERPEVLRTALRPAVAPALPAPPRPRVQPVAPITFGPAEVRETVQQPEQPAALAVLLATGSSVESLRLTWKLLQERHAAALLDLSPRYIVETNPQAPDRSFALLAGPVVSATDVARVCSALVSEGLTCRTRSFVGNSL